MISRLRPDPRSKLLLAVLIAVLLVPIAAGAQQTTNGAATLTTAPPEAGGMSSARLTRVTSAFKKEIEDKKLPGAVMLIARKG